MKQFSFFAFFAFAAVALVVFSCSGDDSKPQYFFCAYPATETCVAGLVTECPSGGKPMENCPSDYSKVLAQVSSSSSGGREYAYCVFISLEDCLDGPHTSCLDGGMLSNSCPFARSSSSDDGEGGGGSSSSVGGFTYCVYHDLNWCARGPFAACEPGGFLSNACPYLSSSSRGGSSSSPSSSPSGGSSSSSEERFATCRYENPYACYDADEGYTACPDGTLSNEPCLSPEYSFCVNNSTFVCLEGKFKECDVGFTTSNECPSDFESKSCGEGYNDYATFRTRKHYCSDGTLKEYGYFTDSRNEKTYKTVVIGGRTWFAENLNLLIPDPIDPTKTLGDNRCYGIGQNQGANGRDDNNNNCLIYGRYYTFATLVNLNGICSNQDCLPYLTNPHHQGICPGGWHIPSKQEFDDLVIATGNDHRNIKTIGSLTIERELNGVLVTTKSPEWSAGDDAKDKFGFSGLRHNLHTPSQATPSTSNLTAYYTTSGDPDPNNTISIITFRILPDGFGTNANNGTGLATTRCIKDY